MWWWWDMLVFPVLRKRRQGDPWGILVSHASIGCKFQSTERHYLKKEREQRQQNKPVPENGWTDEQGWPVASTCTSTQGHIYEHTRTCIHKRKGDIWGKILRSKRVWYLNTGTSAVCRGGKTHKRICLTTRRNNQINENEYVCVNRRWSRNIIQRARATWHFWKAHLVKLPGFCMKGYMRNCPRSSTSSMTQWFLPDPRLRHKIQSIEDV